ncbi:BA71V-QP509L, partial [Elysia marginata]
MEASQALPLGGPDSVGVVTPLGLRVSIASLTARLGSQKNFRRFLKTLIVTEKPQPGRPKAARVCRFAYSSGAGFLYIPSVKIPTLLGHTLGRVYVDPAFARARQLGGGIRRIPSERWIPTQAFYSYQSAAAEYLCRPAGPLGFGGVGVAYVQMGTGLGKTRLGLAVSARGRGPVFVVVPTEAIRLQWLDEFQAIFPQLRCAPYNNPPKTSNKTAPHALSHDVVVGIINTVRAKKPGFFEGYSTVILDEAHELHTPKNLNVLWLAQGVPRVLGLSATPDDRVDGLDRVVYHFLGAPIRAERDIPGLDMGNSFFAGRVREVEYSGHPDFCEAAISAAGTVSAIETIGTIIRDPARLRLVAAEIERVVRLHESEPPNSLLAFGLGPPPASAASKKFSGVRSHGVFVFAEHREYLSVLRESLLERFAPEDIEMPEMGCADADAPVVLRGGATRDQISRAHRARIVLTTYGYSRRGVSLVEMTAIVLATPRRNGMRQILGRITRRGSDESILRIVVDIKDVRTALKSQSSDRRKVYIEK